MTKRQCKNCQFYEDFSEVDPEEPQGYCGHPTPLPEDVEHGGHWTASDSVCERHQRQLLTNDPDGIVRCPEHGAIGSIDPRWTLRMQCAQCEARP